MTKLNKKEPLILALGDFAFFIISLWVALFLRYFELPSKQLFLDHLVPFSFLFVVWIVVFFIAGLYEKQTLMFRKKLPGTLLRAHIGNTVIAVIFFYLIPFYSITPKTNLLIDVIVSFAFILCWRFFSIALISVRTREHALLIASGSELSELRDEVNRNSRFTFHFDEVIDLDAVPEGSLEAAIADAIAAKGVTLVVADLSDRRISALHSRLAGLLLSGVTVLDFAGLFEDVFERVPLSMLSYRWFLENVSISHTRVYDAFKRVMDILLAIPVGVLCAVFFPFVFAALKLQDGGTLWSRQERVGQDGKIAIIYKFRTMDRDYRGGWVEGQDPRVTRVGKFLRKSRIDEFPQFWNVLRGDLSFIGPRPDIIGNYEHLVLELPYYRVRTVVKPGLSGWAQVKQELPPQSLEETRLRLSYDFYYVKNRSLSLDIRIALKTIKTLLSRLGI